MNQIVAATIFLATIAAIIARPPRFPEWLAATIGAFLMVVTGVEPVRDAALEVAAQWNVLLFFAGLTAVVAVAESAGFFARGRDRRTWIGQAIVLRYHRRRDSDHSFPD